VELQEEKLGCRKKFPIVERDTRRGLNKGPIQPRPITGYSFFPIMPRSFYRRGKIQSGSKRAISESETVIFLVLLP